LRQQIESAPIGEVIRQLLDDQVNLITSLPSEALRIATQERALAAAEGGERYANLLPWLRQELPAQLVDRATLIARTEVARSQSVITQTRAQHIGSTSFQWMTANDAAVRQLHRDIAAGKGETLHPAPGGGVYYWNDLPKLDDGRPGAPGSIWNCRCFGAPILPAVIV
jgi:uncharacterized protein with gpF-like domain